MDFESIRKKITDEFLFFFHPIYNLRRNIICYEVLVRTYDPKSSSYITPSNLLKQIAKNPKLSNFLLMHTILYLESHVFIPELVKEKVSINLNFVSLLSIDIVKLLEMYELYSHRIVIEITEQKTKGVKDMSGILSKLYDVKKMGFSVSIDDVFIGHDDLRKICSMPIDCVKFDYETTDLLCSNYKGFCIAKDFIKMMHHANIKVISEGIDSERKFNIMKNFEADGFQGYYLCRPFPIENMKNKIN
uniref:REC domain-containing phosphodiesterase n=1 Tax=Edwardsiella tarda TaxID=636 RepID=A0A2S1PMM6_EDWTA|nr:REC domain-containing phosphodiesterase [Edwardsiella tarda]